MPASKNGEQAPRRAPLPVRVASPRLL